MNRYWAEREKQASARGGRGNQVWHRPDKICGECVYGMPYVHEGGIYVVVRCQTVDGVKFRGHYERACWRYIYNASLVSFGQSYMEAGRRQADSRQASGSVPQKGGRQGQFSEGEESYPF